MPWTDTNATESHLRSESGKIIGKIRRGYDHPSLLLRNFGYKSKPWKKWSCFIHTPRLQPVGERVDRDSAKRLVETAIWHRSRKANS